MRWLLVAIVIATIFGLALVLTARHAGGWHMLRDEQMGRDPSGLRTRYLVGALVLSVVAAVLINPLGERSVDGDIVRSVVLVVSIFFVFRTLAYRQSGDK